MSQGANQNPPTMSHLLLRFLNIFPIQVLQHIKIDTKYWNII
jgi:hypothetical protein